VVLSIRDRADGGIPASLESSVRSVVLSIDRQLPLFDVRTGNQILALGVTPVTFLTVLMVSFAAIGLLLTSIGLYGVLSYAVVKRTREIGIRIRSARAHQLVLSIVLRRSAMWSGGLLIGVAGRSPHADSSAGCCSLHGEPASSVMRVSVMVAAAWLAPSAIRIPISASADDGIAEDAVQTDRREQEANRREN